jgi:DNA primase
MEERMLEVTGRDIAITSPGKVFFPERGETKLDLEPRWDSYQVRAAAVAAARELERRRPELVTSAWWKEERGRRVFVDYNQNAPHKTVFGAWSVRACPGGWRRRVTRGKG